MHEGYQRNEVFFPAFQPLDRAYAFLMGNLAQQLHEIGENRRICVSGMIQHMLRKTKYGVRVGDLPDIPTGYKELYDCIAANSNCFSSALIRDAVDIINVDKLSTLWEDYKRELTKCVGKPLHSGKPRRLPEIESNCEDLAPMAVKVVRHPDELQISHVLAIQQYYVEHMGLDLAQFEGYTEGCTVLYFAIAKAAVPFMPSLLLSHLAQLRRLEILKIAVFGYFAVDLENAQAYALVSNLFTFG